MNPSHQDSSAHGAHFHERRATATETRQTMALEEWFEQILENIDYGILVADAEGVVLHANGAADHIINGPCALRVRDRVIVVEQEFERTKLRQALQVACRRGLRTLLALGEGDQRVCIAVVPLPGRVSKPGAAMLIFGKRAVCEELSAQWYARFHGLTYAESHVLRLLCGGEPPAEIARRQCVAMSTVRSQIVSIRAKTGTRSIGALLRQIAILPPLVGVLGLEVH